MVNAQEMLRKRIQMVVERSEKVVKEVLGENHTLHYLPPLDRERLTILWIWEMRHHVSVEEILRFLLPYFQSIAKKQKPKRVMGLPVRVQTLISKTTEQRLVEHLEEEMSAMVRNKLYWESRRNYLLRQNDEREPMKTLKDFESISQWATYYDRQVRRRRKDRQERLTELKQTLPYRGNPWR